MLLCYFLLSFFLICPWHSNGINARWIFYIALWYDVMVSWRRLFADKQYHLSPAIIGLVFLASPAFYAFGSPMWGWIVDKMVRLCVLTMLTTFFRLIYVSHVEGKLTKMRNDGTICLGRLKMQDLENTGSGKWRTKKEQSPSIWSVIFQLFFFQSLFFLVRHFQVLQIQRIHLFERWTSVLWYSFVSQ